MEYPKIEIYRTRTFSEKLSDTFSFMRENWRPMLKYFIYLMLPTSIVLALPFNHFFEGYLKLSTILQNPDAFETSDMIWYGVSGLASALIGLFSVITLEALVFAMIRLYNKRPQRLAELSFEELKPELLLCMKRCIISTLTGFGLVMLFLLLIVLLGGLSFLLGKAVGAVISVLLVIVLYVAFFACIFPLSLVPPIYLLEDEIDVWNAFRKAFRLGFATWGGVFAVLFVISLLTGVIQSFTMMPWYLMAMVKTIFSLTDDLNSPIFQSFVYTFAQYLTCILMCLGYLLSEVFTFVGATIQYGHASDKIDGVGVARKIEKFDEFDNF
jgi:hypothetical protein